MAQSFPPSELFGYDIEHQVEQVTIRNIQLNGETVESKSIIINLSETSHLDRLGNQL